MPGGGTVRAIKQRISSVENTSKVTHAMELVAASKMRRAQDRALSARPYATQMRAVLSQLSGYVGAAGEEAIHPLLAQREIKNFALIHITSDRGLAGGLNANMNRASASVTLERQPEVDQVSVLSVGRKGRDFFRRAGFPMLAEFTELGDFPSSSDVLPIARIVMEDYIVGKLDQVFIGFQTFVNPAVQRPTIRQVLPVQPPESEDGEDGEAAAAIDFIFEPSPEALLETLLPRYVEMQVFEAILEAQASEQSARMVAMRQATDAAQDMVADLTLVYNKARQELITGELLDIVGGKAALEQG
jgi:F-type H+-transporting ATPase subunit gamma